MALLIQADGTTRSVWPALDAESFSLAELQRYVGGYIEVLRVGGLYLLLNEQGKLKQLPFNAGATELAQAVLVADFIVGDALLCTLEELGEDEADEDDE